MTAPKYIANNSGKLKEVAAVQTGGGGNANKIPALDANGLLDSTMMPTGFGDEVMVLVASEALAAGAWVNVWNSSGAFKVRNADATTAGKECDGFVLASVSLGGNATVYFDGTNTQVTGMTPGAVFLSTTAGVGTATAPSASGNVVQRVGTALSATAVDFEAQPGIELA